MRLLVVGVVVACVAFVGAGCPSEECRDYVRCQKAYDALAAADPVDVSEYEDGGACWGNLQSAQLCTAQCKEALAALAALANAPAECAVD